MQTRLGSITKWTSIVVVVWCILVVAIYLVAFDSFQIIGESIECSTNAPFAFEYSCGLRRYGNDTQYWTFDWSIPDGIVINNLMVRSYVHR